jgi:hypothetical protein
MPPQEYAAPPGLGAWEEMRCYTDAAPDGAADGQPVLIQKTHAARDASAGRRAQVETTD